MFDEVDLLSVEDASSALELALPAVASVANEAASDTFQTSCVDPEADFSSAATEEVVIKYYLVPVVSVHLHGPKHGA